MLKQTLNRLALTALTVAVMGTAAHATQIGQFLGGSFSITNVGVNSETFSAAAQTVNFQFQIAGGPSQCSGINTCLATLTFTATTSNAATGTTTLDENGFHGSFSIIGQGALAGKNLLSGTFGGVSATQGDLGGINGGTGATFTDTTTGGNTEVVLSSDFFVFTPDESFSLSLSNLTPVLGIDPTNHVYNSATASATGTFNASAAVTTTPEPTTMALLGSALVGLGLLGRKRLTR